MQSPNLQPVARAFRCAWILAVVAAALLPGLALSVRAADMPGRIVVGGTGCALGGASAVAKAFEKKHPGVTVRFVPSLGSGGGIKAALAGSLDVALSARPVTNEERSRGAVDREYARSPFVFVVAAGEKKRALTLRQVAAIYAGEMQAWPDGRPIRLVLRPEADTDTMLLKLMSPGMERAVRTALSREGMLTATTDQENADLLAKVKGAFGAATLAQILSEKRPLQPLSLDNASPGAPGSYPFLKTFYAITASQSSPAAKRFVEFLLGPEGRAILRRTGHVVPGRAE